MYCDPQTIYLHPVKKHRLLSEAKKQIVGVLGHSEVVQPLLRRQEESLVAILAIMGSHVQKKLLETNPTLASQSQYVSTVSYAKSRHTMYLYMLHESLSTAVDVRHELDPVLVRLQIKGGAFAPRRVVAQPVIVLQMNPGPPG